MGLAVPAGTLRSGLCGTAKEDDLAAPAVVISAVDLVATGVGAGEEPDEVAATRSPVAGAVTGTEEGDGEAIGARIPIVGEGSLSSVEFRERESTCEWLEEEEVVVAILKRDPSILDM